MGKTLALALAWAVIVPQVFPAWASPSPEDGRNSYAIDSGYAVAKRKASSGTAADFAKTAWGYASVGAISRSEWGADEAWAHPESVWGVSGNRWAWADSERAKTVRENCRANFGAEDDRIALKRTTESGREVEYFPVTGIVVHHTATSSKKPKGGWAESVRSIYRMHALWNGWGDIGYNYLVAPDGSVYEGAEGWKHVVGAHALGHNRGNVGISLIGSGPTYPKEQVEALATLSAKLAKIYNLDIARKSLRRSPDCSGLEYAPAIRAHKELDPGKPVDPYLDMDGFRKLAIREYSRLFESGTKREKPKKRSAEKRTSHVPFREFAPAYWELAGKRLVTGSL